MCLFAWDSDRHYSYFSSHKGSVEVIPWFNICSSMENGRAIGMWAISKSRRLQRVLLLGAKGSFLVCWPAMVIRTLHGQKCQLYGSEKISGKWQLNTELITDWIKSFPKHLWAETSITHWWLAGPYSDHYWPLLNREWRTYTHSDNYSTWLSKVVICTIITSIMPFSAAVPYMWGITLFNHCVTPTLHSEWQITDEGTLWEDQRCRDGFFLIQMLHIGATSLHAYYNGPTFLIAKDLFLTIG